MPGLLRPVSFEPKRPKENGWKSFIMVWYGALCHAVHQHIGVVAFCALLIVEHRKTSKEVVLLH